MTRRGYYLPATLVATGPVDYCEWVERAACRGCPTDWWFSSEIPPGERGRCGPKPRYADTRRALSICKGCDVQQECLTFALRVENGRLSDGRFGVFGGMTSSQRAQIDERRGA